MLISSHHKKNRHMTWKPMETDGNRPFRRCQVAQLVGYVSEQAAYHHGEMSLVCSPSHPAIQPSAMGPWASLKP